MAIGSNSRLWKTTVFHHLHGQIGLFTVWINGMQNSGLVSFINLPKNGLEILKLVSKIALENETRVSV